MFSFSIKYYCGFEKQGVSLNEFFLAHDLISFECGWLDFYSENPRCTLSESMSGIRDRRKRVGIGSVVVVNGGECDGGMSDALSRELCTPNVINPRVISDSHYAVVSQRLFHPVSCRKDRIPTQLPGSDHLVAKRLPPELLFALLDRHAAVVADSNVVPVVGEGHLDFHSISGRRSGESAPRHRSRLRRRAED